MVKVYFESGSHADLVAVFTDEEMYMSCLPALKKEAEKHGLTLTESIVEQDLEQVINDLN